MQQVDSPDQLPFLKISFVVNPKDFALEADAERTECALRMSVLMPENFSISLIHLPSVAEKIG